MKMKKIWLLLGLLFLILSLSLFIQTFNDKGGYEEADAESNRQITGSESLLSKDNAQIENKDDRVNKNTLKEAKESGEQKAQIALEDVEDATENDATKTNDSLLDDEADERPMTADEKPSDIAKEENQAPVEQQDEKSDREEELKCVLSVTCATIFDNLDKFNQDKIDIVSEDGKLFLAQEVTFYEGESVLDVLLREMKNNKIHMEYSITPLYNTDYIEGIGNIYEFDCGELSGWIYKVNGVSSNYGSSNYKLNDGDIVEWIYTCDLGKDLDVEYINTEEGEQQ